MKNILWALVVLSVCGFSNVSMAKENAKLKKVIISFSEQDSRTRLPSSVDEKEVIAAQARHVAQAKSLDAAIENLN